MEVVLWFPIHVVVSGRQELVPSCLQLFLVAWSWFLLPWSWFPSQHHSPGIVPWSWLPSHHHSPGIAAINCSWHGRVVTVQLCMMNDGVFWWAGADPWFPGFGSMMVKITGCFDSLPVIWPWYRGSLMKVPGCLVPLTWFHGCLIKVPGSVDLVPWFPQGSSWLPRCGSRFSWLGSIGCHGGRYNEAAECCNIVKQCIINHSSCYSKQHNYTYIYHI